MGKKKKTASFGKKVAEVERGFTVVDSKGKKVYLSSHPDGIPFEDAEKLAAGLAVDCRVVPVTEVG